MFTLTNRFKGLDGKMKTRSVAGMHDHGALWFTIDPVARPALKFATADEAEQFKAEHKKRCGRYSQPLKVSPV